MFDIVSHRNWIISQLYAFIDIPIVPSEGNRPQKPFVAYTIISPYISQPAPPVIQYSDFIKEIPVEPPEEPLEEPPEEPEEPPEVIIENWSKKTWSECPTIVWSFTAISDNVADCYQIILKIRQWFELNGKTALKSNDIVVARVESVNDRSLIMEDVQLEYRIGFDVVLRVISETCIDVETIESVDYTIELKD